MKPKSVGNRLTNTTELYKYLLEIEDKETLERDFPFYNQNQKDRLTKLIVKKNVSGEKTNKMITRKLTPEEEEDLLAKYGKPTVNKFI